MGLLVGAAYHAKLTGLEAYSPGFPCSSTEVVIIIHKKGLQRCKTSLSFGLKFHSYGSLLYHFCLYRNSECSSGNGMVLQAGCIAYAPSALHLNHCAGINFDDESSPTSASHGPHSLL